MAGPQRHRAGQGGLRAEGPRIGRIVVRGLTQATEGNASGIGFADIALRRAAAAVDERKTYLNGITAKDVEGAKIPPVFDTDEDALGAALASCLRVDAATARIVRVRSTRDLELLWISEPALADALATGRCEIVEPAREIAFDADGMLAGHVRPCTARLDRPCPASSGAASPPSRT